MPDRPVLPEFHLRKAMPESHRRPTLSRCTDPASQSQTAHFLLQFSKTALHPGYPQSSIFPAPFHDNSTGNKRRSRYIPPPSKASSSVPSAPAESGNKIRKMPESPDSSHRSRFHFHSVQSSYVPPIFCVPVRLI